MITVGILTISDAVSQGRRHDKSGENIEAVVGRLDAEIAQRAVVPDEADQIAARLEKWADEERLDLVLTTGGTGLGPRDVTPEATMAVVERVVPGLAEVMRLESAKKNPHALLSRAVAGVRGKTLIINLPGSPQGVVETLELREQVAVEKWRRGLLGTSPKNRRRPIAGRFPINVVLPLLPKSMGQGLMTSEIRKKVVLR